MLFWPVPQWVMCHCGLLPETMGPPIVSFAIPLDVGCILVPDHVVRILSLLSGSFSTQFLPQEGVPSARYLQGDPLDPLHCQLYWI